MADKCFAYISSLLVTHRQPNSFIALTCVDKENNESAIGNVIEYKKPVVVMATATQ